MFKLNWTQNTSPCETARKRLSPIPNRFGFLLDLRFQMVGVHRPRQTHGTQSRCTPAIYVAVFQAKNNPRHVNQKVAAVNRADLRVLQRAAQVRLEQQWVELRGRARLEQTRKAKRAAARNSQPEDSQKVRKLQNQKCEILRAIMRRA
jgi:hypothetical protein